MLSREPVLQHCRGTCSPITRNTHHSYSWHSELPEKKQSLAFLGKSRNKPGKFLLPFYCYCRKRHILKIIRFSLVANKYAAFGEIPLLLPAPVHGLMHIMDGNVYRNSPRGRHEDMHFFFIFKSQSLWFVQLAGSHWLLAANEGSESDSKVLTRTHRNTQERTAEQPVLLWAKLCWVRICSTSTLPGFSSLPLELL